MKVQDKQSDRYRGLLADVKAIRITAGVHEKEGSQSHERKEGKALSTEELTLSKGLTVLELAAIHEFGQGVPERSFVRAFFDQNQDRVRDRLLKEFQAVAKGKRTIEQAAERTALWVQAEMQKFISDGKVKPDIEQSTKDRKGSSKALIDTGVLRSSLTAQWEILFK